MTGVELNGGDAAEWDFFVRAQPNWTHFHLAGWRRVFEQAFGHECVYLSFRNSGGTLRGVLPLVRVKSRLFGHYLASLPFVNYGGPLGAPDAIAALVTHASALADAQGVELLELRCRQEAPLDLPVSHRKVTALLDLRPEPDAVWKGLPAKLRSQVRRPQKEGVEVRFGLDQLAPFYEVFARNMRDLGTPVQSLEFFKAIAEVFPGDVWFGCAYLKGQAIAAGCGFRWGREFEMTWASSLSEYNRIAPNMLLYWSFIEKCASEGVSVFNFGRCTPGSGTHRFKLQWGSRDEKLWWFYHAAGDRVKAPSPDDSSMSWGPPVWRKLPLFVANRVGPRVARFIP